MIENQARGLFVAGVLAALWPWAAACSIDSRVVSADRGSVNPATTVVGSAMNTVPPGLDADGADGNAASNALGDGLPHRLTVVLSGAASGRVTSSTPGIDCGSECTGQFSGPVALSAITRDGDDEFFTGWSDSGPDSACNGSRRACSLLMDHDQTVTANFAAMAHNLIFVSSKAYPATLGGVAAYDAECNTLASAAGINDAAGSAFIALMTDSTDESHPVGDILERIGAARGWVRMDGAPVADEPASLVGPAQYYPPSLTEQGGTLYGVGVWTGFGIDQPGDDHCGKWTQARAGSRVVQGSANVLRWSGEAAGACDSQNSVYCIGTTKQQPTGALPRVEGKRIWLTTTYYAPGSNLPDQKCQAERPAGVTQGVAYIAYNGRAGSEVLDPGAMYVLSDGRAVGTGVQLLGDQTLARPGVGPWLLADGSAVPSYSSAWIGSLETRTVRGTYETTCRDWTSGEASLTGFTELTGFASFGVSGYPSPCNYSARLYCVEP